MSRLSSRAGAWLLLALAGAMPAAAQVITAEIGGLVTDASGAVLPGATVTARNVATGFERVVKTVRLKVIAEAYNITNRVNDSAFSGNIRSALFDQPISARRPRTLQVGAQVDF